MGFPATVKEEALVRCARHCCLCHRHKGLKIEVHHIKLQSEGGTDTLDNAIPLCFDCHGDMRSYDNRHPIGNNYGPNELVRRRDEWYEHVRTHGVHAPSSLTGSQDVKIFEHLTSLLPWSGSIQFIRSNNFAGFPFDCDRLRDLDNFVHHCENPSFAFVDRELEALRRQLHSHIRAFNGAIGTYTFRVSGTSSFNSVPQSWELESPEHFERAVTLLENSALAVADTYDALVRSARSQLGAVSLA